METAIPIVETETVRATSEGHLAKELFDTAVKMNSFKINVIPLSPDPAKTSPYKSPNVSSWTEWQSTFQSINDIGTFDWSTSSGLAIINGVNGYIAIDFDKINSYAPISDLLDLLRLPTDYSWVVQSGSRKGYHIYLRTDQESIEKQAKGNVRRYPIEKDLFDHLELRIRECYTVIPPSKHLTGNNYIWNYQIPEDAPAYIPFQQIVAALDKISRLESAHQNKSQAGTRNDFTELLMKGLSEGCRNNATAELAGHFKGKNIKKQEALEIIQLWNQTKNSPPLSVQEVQRTVDSIYSYESPSLIIKQEGKPTYYSGSQMKDCAIPAQHDLLEGLIRDESVTFIGGEEGAGKSLLAMNFALSVATGQLEFLKYKIKKSGKVLYLNNELPFTDFIERFKKMSKEIMPPYSLNLDNFIAPDNVPPINDYWNELNDKLKEIEPVLVVLDCLYWAHDKKESDNSEMKELMRQLVALRNTYHTTILVIHHTKKGSRYERMHNDNMRGASVFSGASDTVFQFKRSASDEKKRLFKPTKLRHGSDDLRKARLLVLKPSLWFADDGEANEDDHTERLVHHPVAVERINFEAIFGEKAELSRKEIVELCAPFGYTERTIDRALKLSKQNGEIISKKMGVYEIRKV